jgi:hypothetical protein
MAEPEDRRWLAYYDMRTGELLNSGAAEITGMSGRHEERVTRGMWYKRRHDDMLVVYAVLAGEPPNKGHYGQGVVPLQLRRQ